MPLADTARIAKKSHPKPTYPPDHQAAMRVSPGGSSCATCRYVSKDHKNCSNRHYNAWNGSPKLLYPADEFCSDWWEPAKGVM